jgi:uncharacterized membrane protein
MGECTDAEAGLLGVGRIVRRRRAGFAETPAAGSSTPIAINGIVRSAGAAAEAMTSEANEKNQEGAAGWLDSRGKIGSYRIAVSLDTLVIASPYTVPFAGGDIALFNPAVTCMLCNTHETLWNEFGPERDRPSQKRLGRDNQLPCAQHRRYSGKEHLFRLDL